MTKRSTANDLRYLANHCGPIYGIVDRLHGDNIGEFSDEDLHFMIGWAERAGKTLSGLALSGSHELRMRLERTDRKDRVARTEGIGWQPDGSYIACSECHCEPERHHGPGRVARPAGSIHHAWCPTIPQVSRTLTSDPSHAMNHGFRPYPIDARPIGGRK